MNLLLLRDEDFVAPDVARLSGRRFDHVRRVLRAAAGDTLSAGVLGGKLGTARVLVIEDSSITLETDLQRDPPPPLPVTLVLALPRPKVLNRVIASATSLGVKRLVLVNAWRVEKSYWKSPRLAEENLLEQAISGLEQAKDTMLPAIEIRRLFRPFIENELPELANNSLQLVAHPGALEDAPRNVAGSITLAIGPEGGWIPPELESFSRIGFRAVGLGPRILRVETALAALLARLF